jgi:hypothetical protein
MADGRQLKEWKKNDGSARESPIANEVPHEAAGDGAGEWNGEKPPAAGNARVDGLGIMGDGGDERWGEVRWCGAW